MERAEKRAMEEINNYENTIWNAPCEEVKECKTTKKSKLVESLKKEWATLLENFCANVKATTITNYEKALDFFLNASTMCNDVKCPC